MNVKFQRLALVSSALLAGCALTWRNGFVWISILSLILPGCAARTTVGQRFGLAEQPVYVVHRPGRPFKVDSGGYQLARGAPGVSLLQMAESARFEQRLDLADPVNYGKEQLAAALRRDLGATGVQVIAEPRSESLGKFREKYPKGVLFEIHTEYWGIENYSKTRYLAKAWVVSLERPRKRWAVVCPWVELDVAGQKAASELTQADVADLEKILLADQGAALKAMLRKSAETCADYIARRVTGPGQTESSAGSQEDIE